MTPDFLVVAGVTGLLRWSDRSPGCAESTSSATPMGQFHGLAGLPVLQRRVQLARHLPHGATGNLPVTRLHARISRASSHTIAWPQENRDKHNCRCCGMLVCDPCSQQRRALPYVPWNFSCHLLSPTVTRCAAALSLVLSQTPWPRTALSHLRHLFLCWNPELTLANFDLETHHSSLYIELRRTRI